MRPESVTLGTWVSCGASHSDLWKVRVLQPHFKGSLEFSCVILVTAFFPMMTVISFFVAVQSYYFWPEIQFNNTDYTSTAEVTAFLYGRPLCTINYQKVFFHINIHFLFKAALKLNYISFNWCGGQTESRQITYLVSLFYYHVCQIAVIGFSFWPVEPILSTF